MNRQQQVVWIPWRFYSVIALLILIVLALAARVFYLSILDQSFLRAQGDERVLRKLSSPAFRGMILDRNGSPLAVSASVDALWINPLVFSPSKSELKALAALLRMKASDISRLAEKSKKHRREFVYLKRGLSPDVARSIRQLKIEGVDFQEEYRRYYPEGEVAAHVVGFTNVDDYGQEGLELAYNDWLKGDGGKKWVVKDRLGQTVSVLQTLREQKPGKDLVTSLDRRIQYLAYRELLRGVLANQASSGSAVVLDAKTGEVLAMVNQPAYNPNKHQAVRADIYRNRAVTDIYEPGSTIKAFSIASALDSGQFNSDTLIDTKPGWMRVGRNIVKDEHQHDLLSVREILQISSNVGVTKMVLALPPDQLWDLLHRVGFGEITGIGFPGEQSGVLVKHEPWGAFTLATMAFGYGMSVTTLQLARAYLVLANQGRKLPVTLLKTDIVPRSEQVMKPAIASEMVTLLESVVSKGGTGTKASVPGYRVAGKTGTALMAGNGGYLKHHYISTFVGLAPVSDPRFVVAVVINDPQGKAYYGGDVAGPVFEKIMEGSLRMLSVPPDA